MTPHVRLSRRAMFKAVGTTAAVILFGGSLRSSPVADVLLATRLRALVKHRAAAAVLGSAYVEQVPTEASTALLVTALMGQRARTLANDERRLGAVMARRIRADFGSGRTVVLRGWIVSVTEARLAALTVTG